MGVRLISKAISQFLGKTVRHVQEEGLHEMIGNRKENHPSQSSNLHRYHFNSICYITCLIAHFTYCEYSTLYMLRAKCKSTQSNMITQPPCHLTCIFLLHCYVLIILSQPSLITL